MTVSSRLRPRAIAVIWVAGIAGALAAPVARAEMRTWDGAHAIDRIVVSVVYFVPADRSPLPDWRDRVDYFARRLEQFHRREFGDQSTLTTEIRDTPLVSERSTAKLRAGSADDLFFATLRETAAALDHGRDRAEGFPVLLVFSDINYRPLDDFYRVRPTSEGGWAFEGTRIGEDHFPGAAAGGSRAIYDSARGFGWGLVSADGWRVPYRGSDCVAWHEGVGHAIGLPHPDPQDGSVMAQGQYRGWINESFVNADQKTRLRRQPPEETKPPGETKSPGETKLPASLRTFDALTAVPVPASPTPGQAVGLRVRWPEGVAVDSIAIEYQTAIRGAKTLVEMPDGLPKVVPLGVFESPTPVSYTVRVRTREGGDAEVRGYFQVVPGDGSLLKPPPAVVQPQDAAPHES